MTRAELRILNAFPPRPKLVGAYELHKATGIEFSTVAVTVRRLELAGLRERFERREVAGSGWPALEGQP